MQKSGTLKTKIMPNPKGGLFSCFLFLIFLCANAFAVDVELECNNCYRWADFTHTSCVYDEDYCLDISCALGTEYWDPEQEKCIPHSCETVPQCTGYKSVNYTTCKCECAAGVRVCLKGYVIDPDTCECVPEPVKCDDGYYLDGTRCVLCPENTTSTSMIISICGVHSSNDGANGIADCYKRANNNIMNPETGEIVKCTYSNSIGTFVFEEDCHYLTDRNTDPGAEEVGDAVLGGEIIGTVNP